MTDTQEGRIFPAPQTTLVEIHHPKFLEGYHNGRQWFFRDPEPMTDKHVVELLESLLQDMTTEDAEEAKELRYFYIGQLLGKISGSLLPRQPEEEEPSQKRQEHLLAKVIRDYGEQGPALAQSIQQFWDLHDQLAQALDADDFDQMLRRGAEKIHFL